jgi:hypothetical protein
VEHDKRKSKSRSIHLLWKGPEFRESPVEHVLERAVKDGVVIEFGTNGYVVWLSGYPGPKLRALKAEVSKLVGFEPVSRDAYFNGET